MTTDMKSLNPYEAPEARPPAQQPKWEALISPWPSMGAFLGTTSAFFLGDWLVFPRVLWDLLFTGDEYLGLAALMAAGGLSGALVFAVIASVCRIARVARSLQDLIEGLNREFG